MPIVNQSCCGCPLQVGTIIVAVLYMIGSIGPVVKIAPHVYPVQNITEYEDENWSMWVTLHKPELQGYFGSGIIQAICAIFLIVGAGLEKAPFLLPWVILEILVIIVLTVLSIMICTALMFVPKLVYLGIIVIVAIIIYILISVYCLIVVYSYYQTLCEYARTNRGRAQV